MTSPFTLLEDGNWHTLQEIAQKTKIEIEKLKTQCEEASKKGFIEYDSKSSKARLSHNIMSLLLQLNAKNKTKTKWEKKGVGTATIPAGKAFKIQNLWIQNQTEKDLEITFTFNPKPKEIIIQEAKN
jgi:predicted DNA-binding ribbon-helix-helix protein